MNKDLQNILIYRLGSLGDIIVSLPCLYYIRKLHPEAQITLLTNEPVSGKAAPAMSILEGTGLCDYFLGYPVGLRNPLKIVRLCRAIKKGSFDIVYNLAANRGFLNSMRDMIFFRLNGIFRIVGTAYRASERNSPQSLDGIYVRESTHLALRLNRLGGVDIADPKAWSLKYTKAEIFDAKTLCKCLSKRTLVIAPGTKQPIKDWGQDRWAHLIGHVAKILPDWSLVLIGSEDEKERCEELRRFWNGDSLNLCGITSPRLSGAVLSLSSLFVGVDSGPMHLASASGTKVIGIFSGNNPEGQWSPGSAEWDKVICLHPTNRGPWKERYRISPPQSLLPVSVDAVIMAIRHFFPYLIEEK